MPNDSGDDGRNGDGEASPGWFGRRSVLKGALGLGGGGSVAG